VVSEREVVGRPWGEACDLLQHVVRDLHSESEADTQAVRKATSHCISSCTQPTLEQCLTTIALLFQVCSVHVTLLFIYTETKAMCTSISLQS
jgi:hypothetical protein